MSEHGESTHGIDRREFLGAAVGAAFGVSATTSDAAPKNPSELFRNLPTIDTIRGAGEMTFYDRKDAVQGLFILRQITSVPGQPAEREKRVELSEIDLRDIIISLQQNSRLALQTLVLGGYTEAPEPLDLRGTPPEDFLRSRLALAQFGAARVVSATRGKLQLLAGEDQDTTDIITDYPNQKKIPDTLKDRQQQLYLDNLAASAQKKKRFAFGVSFAGVDWIDALREFNRRHRGKPTSGVVITPKHLVGYPVERLVRKIA